MTDALDAEAWTHRYEANDTPWDLAGPTPWLTEWLKSASPQGGRVVVPGCGKGHDAHTLAQAGFNVVGMDFAAPAIAAAEQGAKRLGVAVRWEQADWLHLPESWHGQFDWVFEHTCLCAIQPGDRPAYVQAAWQALKPGGHLAGVLFTHRRQGGPPFGMTPQAARDLLGSHFEIMSLTPITCSIPARQGDEHALIARRRDRITTAHA